MPELFGKVRDERCDHADHRIGDHRWGRAVELGQLVVELGNASDRGVEAERIHVRAHCVDGAMQCLIERVRDIDVGDGDLAAVLVDEVAPDALQET